METHRRGSEKYAQSNLKKGENNENKNNGNASIASRGDSSTC